MWWGVGVALTRAGGFAPLQPDLAGLSHPPTEDSEGEEAEPLIGEVLATQRVIDLRLLHRLSKIVRQVAGVPLVADDRRAQAKQSELGSRLCGGETDLVEDRR